MLAVELAVHCPIWFCVASDEKSITWGEIAPQSPDKSVKVRL
jgi:hypothetical protein